MNVFVILGILFVALIIIVPLLEKSNMRMSDETTSKISRWIYPLMGIILVIALLRAIF